MYSAEGRCYLKKKDCSSVEIRKFDIAAISPWREWTKPSNFGLSYIHFNTDRKDKHDTPCICCQISFSFSPNIGSTTC